jgi:hypothetical protein
MFLISQEVAARHTENAPISGPMPFIIPYNASLDISVAGTFGKHSNTLSQSRVMQFGLWYEW